MSCRAANAACSTPISPRRPKLVAYSNATTSSAVAESAVSGALRDDDAASSTSPDKNVRAVVEVDGFSIAVFHASEFIVIIRMNTTHIRTSIVHLAEPFQGVWGLWW